MTQSVSHCFEPKICVVTKRENFEGYGFNLHSEKGKSGQFIGKVDEFSPAEASGLRQGLRIIEVNGVEIHSETHKQVVERIKSIPNHTELLVISEKADLHNTEQIKIIEKFKNALTGKHENNNEKAVHTINNNKSEVGESEINGNVSLDSTDSSNLSTSTSTGTLSLAHLSVEEAKSKFLKQKKRPDAKSAIEKYEIIQKM